MNKAARAQLVKSVLTSIVTYHTMVFPSLNGWQGELISYEETSFGRVTKGMATKVAFAW
jgi:hypothetical protein